LLEVLDDADAPADDPTTHTRPALLVPVDINAAAGSLAEQDRAMSAIGTAYPMLSRQRRCEGLRQ